MKKSKIKNDWSSISTILQMIEDIRKDVEALKRKRRTAPVEERACIEANLTSLYGLLAAYIKMFHNHGGTKEVRQ